jgi:chromosome segregation ATPase
MPRHKKESSVHGRLVTLNNQVINLETELSTRNPSVVEAARERFFLETRLQNMTVERNRLRVRVANLEEEVQELRRRVRENSNSNRNYFCNIL